jgi:hypothetical protein
MTNGINLWTNAHGMKRFHRLRAAINGRANFAKFGGRFKNLSRDPMSAERIGGRKTGEPTPNNGNLAARHFLLLKGFSPTIFVQNQSPGILSVLE